jgi:GH43 family beta-xylosidase
MMVNRLTLVLLLFLTLQCGKSGKNPAPNPPPPTNTFTNPLLPSGPDPWIIRKDNNYYYTHTLGNRIGIWKTARVSELKNAAVQTIWNPPATGANSKNIWAPEIHFLNGKWYAYYTAGSGDLSTQRTFVLENANADPLTGTWTDKGKIGDAAADYFAIDGTVFTHNNMNYFIWSGQASATDNIQRIYIARMSDPWTLSTSRVLISSPQYDWEKNGGQVNEGPEILKNSAGKVFLVYSASGCWTDDYALGMMTLQDNGDPLNASAWVKSPSPVFTKKPSNAAYGPGHNAFFKSVDGTEDWIIYHANSSAGQGCGDARNPRMQKFTWSSTGVPVFGEPVAAGSNITKPSGE